MLEIKYVTTKSVDPSALISPKLVNDYMALFPGELLRKEEIWPVG